MADAVEIPLEQASVRLRVPCDRCGGTGKAKNGKACRRCKGSGQLTGLVTLPELARLLNIASRSAGILPAEVNDIEALPGAAA